jgi:hypothetical protein
MVTQLGYLDLIVSNFVNDSMFVIYASGPVSRKCMLERLWLTDSLKGTSLNLFYQGINTMEDFFIVFLPIKVILPGTVGKD